MTRRLAAWLRRLVSIAIVPTLIVALTDFVVDYANPFGVGSAIEAAVARLVQREAAALASNGQASPGQKSVTVVLINREFISGVTGSDEPVWPLPVATLMRGVIQPILREKPAAVFIDLAFPKAPREIGPGVYETDAGQGVQNAAELLAAQLAAIDRNPAMPPIFLADVIEPTAEDDALKGACDIPYVADDLLAARSVMSRDLRAGVFGGDSAAKRITLVDSGVLNAEGGYRLAPSATGPARSCGLQLQKHDLYIPSPAVALLRAYCPPQAEGGPERRGRCDAKRVRALVDGMEPGPERDPLGFRRYTLSKPAARNVMELRWRTNLTPETREAFAGAAGADVCLKQFRRSRLEPLILYAVTLFKPLEKVFARQLDRPCMAIDTITPDQLSARFAGGEGLKGRSFGEVFVKDRIVLIGVDLAQAGDRYESPVNGFAPGVYVHATAVENLLSRGDRFSPAEATLGGTIPLYLASAIAVFVLRWLWRRMLRVGRGRWPPIGELVLAPLAYLVMALVVSIGFLILFESLLPAIGVVLPLTKIALPVIAVHLVLFADWGERLRDWITGIALRRTPPETEGA